MPREKEKLGERQDPRQPPVLLACDKEAEKEKHYMYVYMDVYVYIHIYIYMYIYIRSNNPCYSTI